MTVGPDIRPAVDLGALEAITDAVGSGLGLPEVVRAAARALDASLVLMDHAGAVLAVAARSSADERALMADVPGVSTHELRVGDEAVGRLRLRGRSGEPAQSLLRIVTTLIASEVERVRAPERASAAAQEAFVHAVLDRSVADRAAIVGRAAEVGLDLEGGAVVVVVRAHHFAPTEDDSRARVLGAAERAARAAASGSIAAIADRAGQIVVMSPASDDVAARRVADAIARELQAGVHGFTFAVGHSRVALDPVDLYRAGNEALLAANVAEPAATGEPRATPPVLAFEATGAYRLLLPAMSEDPGELQRFYAETVEPLVAYDDQYETDLVQTLETFLECDGNVANTAARLFTHRHTIRYRLERVRDLCGLDVASTDGREKLGLGLKAMRVLGIAAPRGPATEAGAGAGRVPRGP
ncbi:MAG TPA: helix-turn-helix domain-containing protein, partial [Solirubrobacteraceae bacterium]|nr:helix-turn-helix domain-containing protein [Solirubrobacteraceae bacterium]